MARVAGMAHFLTRALALYDVSHQRWEATSGHPLGREDLS